MGYYVSMEINVKIKETKAREIAQVFKILESDRNSWVNPGFSQKNTIIEMFEEWGYEVAVEDSFYVVKYFENEKLGDDEKLWRSLSHLIEEDCEIVCSGEDHCFWKWVFKNGEMKELTGKIVYE